MPDSPGSFEPLTGDLKEIGRLALVPGGDELGAGMVAGRQFLPAAGVSGENGLRDHVDDLAPVDARLQPLLVNHRRHPSIVTSDKLDDLGKQALYAAVREMTDIDLLRPVGAAAARRRPAVPPAPRSGHRGVSPGRACGSRAALLLPPPRRPQQPADDAQPHWQFSQATHSLSSVRLGARGASEPWLTWRSGLEG